MSEFEYPVSASKECRENAKYALRNGEHRDVMFGKWEVATTKYWMAVFEISPNNRIRYKESFKNAVCKEIQGNGIEYVAKRLGLCKHNLWQWFSKYKIENRIFDSDGCQNDRLEQKKEEPIVYEINCISVEIDITKIKKIDGSIITMRDGTIIVYDLSYPQGFLPRYCQFLQEKINKLGG